MLFHLLAQSTVQSALFDAKSIWDRIILFVTERGSELAVNLLAALAIFIIGRYAAKLLTRLCIKAMAKAKLDATLEKFLANIIHTLFLILVAVAAIHRLGIDTTSLAAILAAGGLAAGFALQSSLANFASGVMLILFKPFGVGDYVEAGGTAGTVEEIHIFSTKMRTGDNVQIIVPNGRITTDTITNYSAKSTRRINLVVGCGYGDDLKKVKAFLVDLLTADERILEDPEPFVAVSELGDSSINFVVRPWVASGDYWAVRYELNEKIKLGFDENGFNIPYPTQDIHIHGMTA